MADRSELSEWSDEQWSDVASFSKDPSEMMDRLVGDLQDAESQFRYPEAVLCVGTRATDPEDAVRKSLEVLREAYSGDMHAQLKAVPGKDPFEKDGSLTREAVKAIMERAEASVSKARNRLPDDWFLRPGDLSRRIKHRDRPTNLILDDLIATSPQKGLHGEFIADLPSVCDPEDPHRTLQSLFNKSRELSSARHLDLRNALFHPDTKMEAFAAVDSENYAADAVRYFSDPNREYLAGKHVDSLLAGLVVNGAVDMAYRTVADAMEFFPVSVDNGQEQRVLVLSYLADGKVTYRWENLRDGEKLIFLYRNPGQGKVEVNYVVREKGMPLSEIILSYDEMTSNVLSERIQVIGLREKEEEKEE